MHVAQGLAFAAVCITLGGCSATDDDAPARMPEVGGQTGEGGGPIIRCYAEEWLSPDAPRLEALCEAAGSELPLYGCTCNHAECPSDADNRLDPRCAIRTRANDCAAALRSTCGRGPGLTGFCRHGSSTCWGDASSVTCRCSSMGDIQVARANSCEAGLAWCSSNED